MGGVAKKQPKKTTKGNSKLMAWSLEIMSASQELLLSWLGGVQWRLIWTKLLLDTAVSCFSSKHLKAWYKQANIVWATSYICGMQ